MIPLRDTQPSYSRPYVTIAIILANITVFFFELSLDDFSRNEFVSVFGVVPARPWIGSFLTHMFLHGGWMHILGNMWFLWIYGDNVEDILGHGKYLLFYLGCGLIAGVVQTMASPGSRIPLVGASGAIAGIMGAYLVKFPHSRILTLFPIIIFFWTAEIPAVWILIYWFVLQFVSGVGQLGDSSGSGGVAWFAHVGGFIAGFVIIRMMRTRERYRHRYDLNW
ncbi:MAG: rhomboid family intramembrane serine protease [Acidobacteria bacterium]|nr:rhomboid family intramembrane serine protease [Acidobacteriota bacterium]